MKLWHKDFVTVCLSSFFIFLNFYMLASALPLYVKETLHGNQQQMGLVITFWAVGCVSLRLFSGYWADRFGKKTMSVLALLLFLLMSAAYLGVSSIVLLLAIRVVHGSSYGVAATATSALATDLIPDSRKGEGIGYFSMFMSIAMVIGPALGLFLWDHFEHESVLFAVGIVVSGLALLSVMLVRQPVSPESSPPVNKEKLRLSRIMEKKALPISLVGLVLAFSYSSLTSFISSYAQDIHQDNAAGLFFIVFAALIIVSRPVVGRVIDKYGDKMLVYPGIAFFAAGMLLLSQADGTMLLLIAGGVIGLGYGALVPAYQTFAVLSVPSERRGAATSTFFLFFDLGYGIGSYVLGLIADAFDFRVMYVVAGVVVLLSAVPYFVVRRRK